jgi:YD repeat-containing protein
VARGFDIGRSFQMNGIDNVNLFNGSLTVTIPIGQRYHVNGNLQYGLTLVYNSNIWDVVTQGANNTTTYPNRRSNAGMGWMLSLGRLFPKNQFPLQETADWNYESPDGGLHQFVGSGVDGSAGPYFTSDGSYLRLVVNTFDRTVEFPDGTQQVFQDLDSSVNPWAAQGSHGRWRLRTIKDRFGNAVNIDYSSTLDYREIWTINDGMRMQTVYFVAAPALSATQTNFYDLMLDHVVLATFGAPAEPLRTWRMTYDTQWLGSGNPDKTTFNNYTVPLLTLITLPPVGGVSQTYSMRRPDNTTFYGMSADRFFTNGALFGMQLPTKGWIEWDYETQTFTHDPQIGTSRSQAVTQRRTLSADRAAANTSLWRYSRAPSTDVTCVDSNSALNDFGPEQLVVSVTSPEGVTSVHYFSIFQNPDEGPIATCTPVGGFTFNWESYALPFTTGVPATFAGQEHYLSEETYLGTPSIATSRGHYRVTGGTLQRSEWSLYSGDLGNTDHTDLLHKPESAHTTKYDVDAQCGVQANEACYTSISRYSHDGAGHYRQSSSSGNFASGNFVTTFTNYTGVSAVDPWLLNRFSEQCTVEDSIFRGAMSTSPSCSNLTAAPGTGTILSGPFIKQYCFDGTTGFLSRQRTLAGTVPAAHDLLASFAQQSGNVTQEDYFGGDTQSLGTETVCNATLPTASAYRILHTYSNGSLATSKYPNLPSPGFLFTDNTIDASTGLVSSSRDAAGVETIYLYDALGRIKKVTPPSTEVPTTFTYAETSAPFSVTAESVSSSGTIQAITEFDGLGRVSKETKTLPTSTTSRTTTYTGSGWLKSVSQWEATPAHYTTYTYDPFGRPLTITAPDASVSTLAYGGVRTTTRTINIGTALSGTVVSPSPTITTETYDGRGRLAKVHDAAGNDTTYEYDVSGHLTAVRMGVQSRLFTYDGRGFLTDEQHPELNNAAGKVVYGAFDARGRAGTKFLGSSLSDFDLAYTYDAAERLTQIDQITARSPLTLRLLKTFTFGTAGGATAKLSQDVRHNYRGSDDFKATQDYTYRASDGKLTDRQTTIDKNSTRLQQFTQSYAYTNIGDLATLTYPTCSDTTRPCGASSLSAVSPGFTKGMITSLPGFADSITYHDDGTVYTIAHPGGITDTYEADDNAMGRPKSIAFQSYDTCTGPTSVSVGRTPAGSLTPQTTVLLTATPAAGYSNPLTYQWYRVVNSNAVPISGATAPTFSEAIAATTTYRVRVANGCGGRDSAELQVPVCSPVAITTQPASQSTSPATLSVTATGCGTLSYQWYQISGSSNIAVGANSPTYITGTLTVTTTFWVKVTDSQNGTSVNSSNAVVSAGSCTPQITQDLLDQSVDYGGTVSVHITVSGCTGKSYHWFSGQTGDTSTPLLGGYFDGTPNITNQALNHGPIWVRVDGDTITPVNSRTAMISVRPVSVNAALTVNTTNQITITWQAFAHHYLVKRCANGACDAPFSATGGTSVNDVNRNLNTTYVYRIASVDPYGTASAFSNPDLATTLSFTPVVSNGVIDRTHINELLTAVNLVRAANGSPPVTWAAILPNGVPAPPAAGQPTTGVYAAHITSLRMQMDAALTALGIPLTPYTDPQTLTFIKAVHFTDLQARIR